MRKVILLIGLICLHFSLLGQQNCPPGYVSRKVKCEGKIIMKCVPENLSCSNCFQIVWEHCFKPVRGGDAYANSYEGALQIADDRLEMFKNSNCKNGNNINYAKYTIYLNGGSNCSDIGADRNLINDVKKRFEILKKRHNDEKNAFAAFLKRNPRLPGSVINEYYSNLKTSNAFISRLSLSLYLLTERSLDDFSWNLDALQRSEDRLESNRRYITNYVATLERKNSPNKEVAVKENKNVGNSNNTQVKKSETLSTGSNIKGGILPINKTKSSNQETNNQSSNSSAAIKTQSKKSHAKQENLGYTVVSIEFLGSDEHGSGLLYTGVISPEQVGCKELTKARPCLQDWFKRIVRNSKYSSLADVPAQVVFFKTNGEAQRFLQESREGHKGWRHVEQLY